MAEVQKRKEKWEKEIVPKSLERLPERGKFFTTSGIPVGRVCTPFDIEDFDYLRDLGFPGEYPLTRGVYPTIYQARFWTMRQYAGFGTAKQTNQHFKYLLEQGQKGLSVAFDFPTSRLQLRRPNSTRISRQSKSKHKHPTRHGNNLQPNTPKIV